MEKHEIENIFHNVNLLSALAKFNSERNDVIIHFYESIIKSDLISKERIAVKDVVDFVDSQNETQRTEEAFSPLSELLIYTMPTNIHYGWNLSFSATRYGIVKNEFSQIYGFKIRTLGIFEEALRSLIFSKSSASKILNYVYEFENEEEYMNASCIKEPSHKFKSSWTSCITVDLEDFITRLKKYILQNHLLLSSITQDHPHRELDEIYSYIEEEILEIVNILSINVSKVVKEKIAVFQKPLLYFEDERSKKRTIIVPFPYILGSTIHLRYANLISQNDGLRAIEETRKGKVVEQLVNSILYPIPNTNIVKNFSYIKDQKKCEADALFLLSNSIWVIEIKSHPIFKKVPFNPESLVKNFAQKFNEGINQGIRAIDYLTENQSFLKQLNFNKKFSKAEKGIIVVLDGYLPSLLTQNKPNDELMGVYHIYENLPTNIRFYSISLSELHTISLQSDIDNFEEFLLWRTGYRETMPICCYDEKEYWAFYNDRYLENQENKDSFHDMVSRQKDQKVICQYISYRFNEKNHLNKEPF